MYIYTYMHACMHTYKHTYMHAWIHTCITYMTYIHTHAYVHTCMHACIHTYVFAYVHAYVFTHMHIHMYICTCIHRLLRKWHPLRTIALCFGQTSRPRVCRQLPRWTTWSRASAICSPPTSAIRLRSWCTATGLVILQGPLPKKCLAVSMGNTIKIDSLFASSAAGGKVPSLRRLKRMSFPMMKSNRKMVMKMTRWKMRAWMTQEEMTLSLQIFVRWETVWRDLAQFVLTSLSHPWKLYTG